MVTVGTGLDNITVGSIIVWVYPSAVGSDRYIFTSEAGGGWFLSVWTSGAIQFRYHRSVADLIRNSGAVITTNTWQYLATTWDTGAAASAIPIYRGTLATAVAEVGSYGFTTDGSGTFDDDAAGTKTIGNRSDGGAGYGIDGRIAVIGVWNRKLPLAEIQDLQWRPRKTSGCQGLWWLDRAVPDLSGNSNNGTVSGATIADSVPLGPRFGYDRGARLYVPVAGAAVVDQTGSDSATLTESASITAVATAADTSAATDSASILAAASASDTGTATDTASFAAAATGTDPGTLTDAASLTGSATAADPGTLTDAAGLAADATATDSGTAADLFAALDLTGPADTGTVADAIEELLASLTVADAGTLADSQTTQKGTVQDNTGSDTATLAEAIALDVAVVVSEAESLADVVAELLASLNVSDTGTLTDTGVQAVGGQLAGVLSGTTTITARLAGTGSVAGRFTAAGSVAPRLNATTDILP